MNIENEADIVKSCKLCLPDIKCGMIGSKGRIKARISIFPTLGGRKELVWQKIEDCPIRKERRNGTGA